MPAGLRAAAAQEAVAAVLEDSIASEAYGLVHGKRAKTYGHPRTDFKIIAKVWSGLLRDLLQDGAELDEYRVAILMTGLKLARLVKSPDHRDSRVDTIGYMLTMERLDEPTDEELARADAAAVADDDLEEEAPAPKLPCSRCGHTGPGTVCDDWKCPGRDAAVDIRPEPEEEPEPLKRYTFPYHDPSNDDPFQCTGHEVYAKNFGEAQAQFEHWLEEQTRSVPARLSRLAPSLRALVNPSDDDVATAKAVLKARAAHHDREAAELLKRAPRNEVADALRDLRTPREER